jgi:hypothetical protein
METLLSAPGSTSPRRSKFRWNLAGLFAMCALVVWGCESQPYAGTGSQTGNSVVAGRIAPTGSETNASNVNVYLRPLKWTDGQAAAKGGLQRTTTDSMGNYRFVDVPPDIYRIEAVRDQLGWSKTIRTSSETNYAPVGVLVAMGRVRIKLHFTEPIRGGRVEFYGLDRFVEIPDSASGDMQLVVENIPAGLQTMRVYLPQHALVYCQSPIQIGADSTSVIEYEDVDHVDRGPVEDP